MSPFSLLLLMFSAVCLAIPDTRVLGGVAFAIFSYFNPFQAFVILLPIVVGLVIFRWRKIDATTQHPRNDIDR